MGYVLAGAILFEGRSETVDILDIKTYVEVTATVELDPDTYFIVPSRQGDPAIQVRSLLVKRSVYGFSYHYGRGKQVLLNGSIGNRDRTAYVIHEKDVPSVVVKSIHEAMDRALIDAASTVKSE